jgi:tRNA G46 methylase TrmB
MLRRFSVFNYSYFLLNSGIIRNCSSSSSEKEEDPNFRFKFKHLDGKYKRLHMVSNPTQQQQSNFEQELEVLKNLAKRDSQELLNRQNAQSGFSVSQQQQQQQNQTKNPTESSSSFIVSREISDAIGFFPKSQLLLLPNTSGRFKEDERKLTIKHSCMKEAKQAVFHLDQEENNNNLVAASEESQRIMIFGQDTNALALKCAKAMNEIKQNEEGTTNTQPLLIVVDKQLEKLISLNQQLHKNLSSSSSENPNQFLIRATDPYFALLHCVPDRALRRVVVSFPPPCSGDAESHRRIVNHHFLSLVHQKLILGGDIVVATDYLPLHQFHNEQLLITEGKMSWADPPQERRGDDGNEDEQQNETTKNHVSDDKKRKTLTQLRAAIDQQQKKSKMRSLRNDKISSSEMMDADQLLDLASIPTIDEAPPRIKFSLMQQRSNNKQNNGSGFYTMRKFKDMETPDHVILQNSRHVNERRLRYGALKR